MTVRELITYLECVPVDVKEGQTSEEALLDMEIKLRVPSSSGQYSEIIDPARVTKEKMSHREKEVIVITTGKIYDIN